MKALLDGDILTYECGFGVMTGWEGESPPPFDKAAELLDNRIANIVALAGADEYQIYLTGKGNFREKIAVTKPYKGNRLQEKPFHYKNLRAYMQGKHNAIIVDGMEADDAICIEQMKYLSLPEGDNDCGQTIICTRDKDLRQCPGMHYGWELGNQPSFGPKFIDEFGWIELVEKVDSKGKIKKELKGGGLLFFCAQCLLGDKVDNIEGIPKYGPVKAFETLGHIKVYTEAFKAVREAYRGFYGDNELADEKLLEMGQLLWMVRELDEEGKPKIWEFPRMDTEPL